MPKKTNGYSTFHLHAKRNAKRKDAEARQAKYNGLTIAEKFNTLIEGGSKKQRAKLEKLMDKHDAKKASVPTTVEPAKAPKKEKVVEIPTPVEELRPVTQTAVLGEILETNFLCPFCKTKMLSQGRNGGVTVWCPVNDLKICSCSENPYGHSNNAKNAYEIACEKFKHV